MSLQNWEIVASLVITVIITIGVIASMYFSIKALREVQFDRRQRQKPFLSFEHGGYVYPIHFVKAGKRIPGLNPKFVETLFPLLPDDAESVRIKEEKDGHGGVIPIPIGRLKNYGLGPALSTKVTWNPLEIFIGNEKFTIDDRKLSEPLYSPRSNSMPSIPAHIQPNVIAGLPRLPTFIEKDIDKKVKRVDGNLVIKTVDVFNKEHVFTQEFHLFTNYSSVPPSVHITFSNNVIDNKHEA